MQSTATDFQLPYTRTDVYKCSFFSKAIRDSRYLLFPLLYVLRIVSLNFTSLVRSRDESSHLLALVDECLCVTNKLQYFGSDRLSVFNLGTVNLKTFLVSNFTYLSIQDPENGAKLRNCSPIKNNPESLSAHESERSLALAHD